MIRDARRGRHGCLWCRAICPSAGASTDRIVVMREGGFAAS
jgi:hypothetical protein